MAGRVCGQQVEITIRVFKDLEGLPGRYRWDYDVRNVSVSQGYCGNPEYPLGLEGVTLYLPQEMPDLANVTVPEGWHYSVWTWWSPALGNRRGTEISFGNMDEPGFEQGLLPGQTAHFSFTTLPRQIVNLNACQLTQDWDLAGACSEASPLAAPCFARGSKQRPFTSNCEAGRPTGASIAPGAGDPEIEVTSISLSGIPLRIDSNTPVLQGPHWVLNTKEKVPSSDPYDEETSAPAAFLMNGALGLQAQFHTDNVEIANCSIQATLADSIGLELPWGDITPQTVAFTGGASEAVTFTAPAVNPLVGAYDLVMNWRAVSCQTQLGGTIDGPPLNSSRHRIYSLFAQPVAPMETPWAKVLELASLMISTRAQGDLDETALSTALAAGTFYSDWRSEPTRFFRPNGLYKYNPNACLACRCRTESNWAFPLQYYLDRLAIEDVSMQCSDNSDFHAILAAAEGIGAQPLRIGLPGGMMMQTNPYYPAGESGCRMDQFGFHAVGELTSVYDISAKCPVETASGTCNNTPVSCTPGENFFNRVLADYLPLVFQNVTIANALTSRKTVTLATCNPE